MPIQIPANIIESARAADPSPKIQAVLIAFGTSVEGFDYGGAARIIVDRLNAGMTLWEATTPWAPARSEACTFLRRMQAEGYVPAGGVADGSTVPAWLIAAGLLFLLLRKRRRRGR